MGMDLERKDFSYEPDRFIAGADIHIAKGVKTAGEAIEAHAPVTLDKNGKLKKITTSTTGSGETAKTTVNTENLYGVLPEAVAADEEAVVYLTGEFFADSLTLPEGVSVGDVEIPLRNLGIFVR